MNLDDASILAINELKSFDNSAITRYEIESWIVKYQLLYDAFEYYPETHQDQLFFYDCYSHLLELSEVIAMEEETGQALQELHYFTPNDERQLLKWLVKYEYLNGNFISLVGNTLGEDFLLTMRGNLKGLSLFFSIDIIQNCLAFDTIYTQYYIPMMRKYSTFTEDESEAITPFDANYDDMDSLEYHLKRRGIFL
jgi:hypothetical protein